MRTFCVDLLETVFKQPKVMSESIKNWYHEEIYGEIIFRLSNSSKQSTASQISLPCHFFISTHSYGSHERFLFWNRWIDWKEITPV